MPLLAHDDGDGGRLSGLPGEVRGDVLPNAFLRDMDSLANHYPVGDLTALRVFIDDEPGQDSGLRPCNFVELMPRLQEHLKR